MDMNLILKGDEMYLLKYEVVTKNSEKNLITRYRYFATIKMSSGILPKVLKSHFLRYPDESLVYARLYHFSKQ